MIVIASLLITVSSSSCYYPKIVSIIIIITITIMADHPSKTNSSYLFDSWKSNRAVSPCTCGSARRHVRWQCKSDWPWRCNSTIPWHANSWRRSSPMWPSTTYRVDWRLVGTIFWSILGLDCGVSIIYGTAIIYQRGQTQMALLVTCECCTMCHRFFSIRKNKTRSK